MRPKLPSTEHPLRRRTSAMDPMPVSPPSSPTTDSPGILKMVFDWDDTLLPTTQLADNYADTITGAFPSPRCRESARIAEQTWSLARAHVRAQHASLRRGTEKRTQLTAGNNREGNRQHTRPLRGRDAENFCSTGCASSGAQQRLQFRANLADDGHNRQAQQTTDAVTIVWHAAREPPAHGNGSSFTLASSELTANTHANLLLTHRTPP